MQIRPRLEEIQEVGTHILTFYLISLTLLFVKGQTHPNQSEVASQ